jgi:hypothetical protein
LVSEDDAVVIFLAKHSLCDAYACLCADIKQDFDYEKYDLSHIQNAIIEKNKKGKLKIEPIKEEEIERAIKNLKPGKSPDIDGIL